ncbi:MAG: ribosome silencing factor [Candidatus Fimenecus sp.]
MTPKELLFSAVQILDKKKGMDIKALEITEISSVADYFLLATGTSSTHIRALADEVDEELSKLGVQPDHIEGKTTGWILLDYKSVVVHIFTQRERELFNLEKLWGDAKAVDLRDILTD